MEFTNLEKYRELRKQFEDETGDHWTNSQGEPDIDYVSWLEQKLVKESDSLPCVSPRESEFKAALTLLRDLADIQNGAPLVAVEKEWNEIMDRTYVFLEQMRANEYS